jgi:hypothetical protein
MTDDTADNGATDGADATAASKNCPADGAGTGTNRRVPVLPRHVGTCTQAKQTCRDRGSPRESLHRSHDITSSEHQFPVQAHDGGFLTEHSYRYRSGAFGNAR